MGGFVWPEQEAVDTWAKGYGINASAEELYELKEAVSKPRLEVQDRLRQAEAEVADWREVAKQHMEKVCKLEAEAERLKKHLRWTTGTEGTYKCQNCQNLVESEYTNRLFCSYHSDGEYQHETFLDDYCNYFESKKKGER